MTSASVTSLSDFDQISDPKKLRLALRRARRQLSPREQQIASRRLTALVSRMAVFRQARRIAFYLPIDGEINTGLLLAAALKAGKQCFLPVLNPVNPQRLLFVRYTHHTRLLPNKWGIPEPLPHNKHLCPAWALDLVLVPLTGFDRSGNRLGMGKGFYDRSFAFRNRASRQRAGSRSRPVLLGMAHSCQQVSAIQAAPWDVPMDGVASDTGVYQTKRF